MHSLYSLRLVLRSLAFFRLAWVPLLTLISGCAVYAPTLPSTPIVRKGEVEAAASWHLLQTVDGHAAWSPTDHVLVLAEGSWRPDNADTTYFRTKQAGVGAGLYQSFGNNHWYLAGTGGLSLSHSVRGYLDVNDFFVWPFGVKLVEYEAWYWKYYGQGYLAYHHTVRNGPSYALGSVLRYSTVDFSSLTRNGSPLVQAPASYWEPSLFCRLGFRGVQVQTSVGLSISESLVGDADSYYLPQSSFVLGVGVVLHPLQWLKRHQHQPASSQGPPALLD
ncbi:hypothetical protein LJY25_14550 [Hymenobacter sp. BT175]|uniref:hypothetical protein n=1 Tax=Hymenobacter translucens TaxID=2886507 RepID=UPI001D0DF4EE|nr:hypothetical protein [Hymenobacter translucens]MCC2547672.1 hypothetical protein [Hymenobacter translucens]